MEEQYPLWLLIQLFLNLSAENGNEDVPIWEYFGFSHALYLLRRFFGINLFCGESLTLFPFKPLILIHPAKIVNNCLPLRFRQKFFAYVRVPDIIGNLKNKKTASWNKMTIKFYIWQLTVQNSRANTMVTPCQNNARHVFMLSSH